MPAKPYHLQLHRPPPLRILDLLIRKRAPLHPLPAMNTPPLLVTRNALLAQHSRLQRRKQRLGLAERNVAVVARVQDMHVQRRRLRGRRGGQQG